MLKGLVVAMKELLKMTKNHSLLEVVQKENQEVEQLWLEDLVARREKRERMMVVVTVHQIMYLVPIKIMAMKRTMNKLAKKEDLLQLLLNTRTMKISTNMEMRSEV